ncbi:hypothetical protein CO038_02775 [Candidatus Pacearchaeota archaeon CG_4_9_14_0_2_um_filter_39_13]|nr:hypothetical protein [Candidatus Pacearchaeota archaeon]OIO43100.1 MAG: hypothetical protein AUJ64_02870 [Candidatus Pacearchaeota archaeon CG1_02_39_14]PJC44641.1 MAG: hypothetical protein CO038_02775 [Candidatus Pacearchaeota archaeon CG_4_9_14_0_2_um_filter_39_13]
MEVGANYVLRGGVEFGKVQSAGDHYPLIHRIEPTYGASADNRDRSENSGLLRLAQEAVAETRKAIYTEHPVSEESTTLYDSLGRGYSIGAYSGKSLDVAA